MAANQGSSMNDKALQDQVIDWIFESDDKGISSEAMAAALLNRKPNPTWSRFNAPSDPADLNRCIKLLNAAPEARNHMDKISRISEAWRNLVARWSELEQCFIDEVGIDWELGRDKPATKTYALMKEIEANRE